MQLETWPSPTFVFGPMSGEPNDGAPNGMRQGADGSLNPKVLIVEDEGLVAMNIESALAEAGFRVLAVVDTEAEAIDAALRLKPDVILMDITLREGNGISAAQAIQRQLNVHIVFVSGNSDPATLAAARQTRSSGFIRKPFLTDRLASLVREAITAKN